MTGLKEKLWAILFAAAKPLDSEKLASLCRESDVLGVEKALNELVCEIEGPINLIHDEQGWRLTVKQDFAPFVRQVVKQAELSKSVIETLAVIAAKVPVLQSDVIRIRTNKAYAHLDFLEASGFIGREKKGRTKLIRLTPKFYEYFETSQDKLKDKLAKKIEVYERVVVPTNDELESPLELVKEELGSLEVVDIKKSAKKESVGQDKIDKIIEEVVNVEDKITAPKVLKEAKDYAIKKKSEEGPQ